MTLCSCGKSAAETPPLPHAPHRQAPDERSEARPLKRRPIAPSRSDEALLEASGHQRPRQVEPDEHQAALARLALGPRGPRVVAHQLVDALEYHLAVVAGHVQHALVAE